jgi:leucyl-tRNA synthetase
MIKAKNFKWPDYDTSMLMEETINVVIQINGKKRGLIQTKPNIAEEKLFEIIKNDEKIMKYFDQKKIKKKIYIKDKLLNIII